MRVLLAIVCIVFLGSAAQALECPPCGPLYCTSDPAYPAELTKKKQGMSGIPDRYRALMDRVGACVGCIQTAPDSVNIVTEWLDGSLEQVEGWSEVKEAAARQRVTGGELKAYHIVVARRACVCCQQPTAEQRPDWNAKLDMNMDLAISCRKSGDGIACQ